MENFGPVKCIGLRKTIVKLAADGWSAIRYAFFTYPQICLPPENQQIWRAKCEFLPKCEVKPVCPQAAREGHR